ncbi:MAG: DUF7010 family protein [Nitriliruptoraceae bacterium]
MHIAEAQEDVRTVYDGGFHGQLISGVLWLAAAAVATWGSAAAAMATRLLGDTLIFPATTLALRVSGGPSSLPAGHPMRSLATPVAFTVPLGLVVAVATAGYRDEWFFPASMVIVGAHYLPFVFLYGMPLFAVLAAALSSGGVALALWIPAGPAAGGWAAGATLVVFAFLLRSQGRRAGRGQGRRALECDTPVAPLTSLAARPVRP